MNDLRVIAHRGIRGLYTENSLASFKAGVATHADAIEFDIQATKDGQLVVLHTMSSPKKVFGLDQKINDLTWDEIKHYKSGDGERMPTFDEVMAAIKGMPAHIDVKDIPSAHLLVKRLAKIDLKQVRIVSSLHSEALEIIKRSYPSLNTSLQTYKHPFKTIRRAKQMGFSHVTLVLYLLNPITYWTARFSGLKILTYQNYASFLLTWPWFVRLIRLLYPGIAIITDRADKIVPVVKKRQLR